MFGGIIVLVQERGRMIDKLRVLEVYLLMWFKKEYSVRGWLFVLIVYGYVVLYS